jgi:hypothetical protein
MIAIIGSSSSVTNTAIASFDINIPSIIDQNIRANTITSWNELTTQLGIKENLSPPQFSRVYALVYISIYDSLLAAAAAATAADREYNTVAFDNKSFYVSSITRAVSNVLTYLFPKHTNEVVKLKSTQISQLQDHVDNLSIKRGWTVGDRVSQAVIDYAEKDNSDLVWNNTNSNTNETIQRASSNNNCTWNGTNPASPMAGFWKTYILKSGSEVQPGKPLACGSEGDLLDVRETYEISKNRTPGQIAAIHYWGNKLPPVIWNNILNQQIQKYNMSIFDAAYSGVYLNVGMYDGFVSCWYTKYNYWTARPFQRIANLTTEIPTPNFPGYTSGHSVISMVASRVLGEIFSNQTDYFNDKAEEAALSRLWAGIHFKQDIINGMSQGDKIAKKVVEDMHKAIHPFIYNNFINSCIYIS